MGIFIILFLLGLKPLISSSQGGADTVEEVFETTFYFMLHDSRDIQLETLNSLGFICIRHHIFMLESKLKPLYLEILKEEFYPVQQKTKVSCCSTCFSPSSLGFYSQRSRNFFQRKIIDVAGLINCAV